VDETGQPGDAAPIDSGGGAGGPRGDGTRLNGWAGAEAAWSSAGAALEPEAPSVGWRQPSDDGVRRGWADNQARYADLLSQLAPNVNGRDPRAGAAARPAENGREFPDRRITESPLAVQVPASAPPYPYEGDLEDAARLDRERPRPAPSGDAPGTTGDRPLPTAERDPLLAEAARHALEESTPPDGLPVMRPPAPWREPGPSGPGPAPAPGEAAKPAPLPASYPLRPVYEPASYRPVPVEPVSYETPPSYQPPSPPPYPGYSGRSEPEPILPEPPARPPEPAPDALPQRVPAEPDVPTVPEPPSVEPPAETPELARIATHLRRDDVEAHRELTEGFDVQAILAAVREVTGVRDASLRTTPTGAHSLRLDLADGADPAEVSRKVARLLQDRMGLAAAPRNVPGLDPPGAYLTSPAPYLSSQLPPVVRPVWTDAATDPTDDSPTQPIRRRRGLFSARGRASVETRSGDRERVEPPGSTPPAGDALLPVGGAPPAGQGPGAEPAPPRPLIPGDPPGPRVVIDHVQVGIFGIEATVDVRLTVGERTAAGVASGPAVEAYLLRLCAAAAVSAVDELLAMADHADGPARCYVEHVAVVPFGPCEVAVVVLLLSCGGWVEQLAGSAVVAGDNRQAVVRATLAAVNRRLEALLS
jgi:hypothetical protein